jgi:hypothetical protein
MGAGAIASTAVSLGQAGYNAYQARKQGKRMKRSIRAAYATADHRMVEDQGYTRQGENEGMNARGLVNGGQATAAPYAGPISSAPIPAAAGGMGSRLAQAFAQAPHSMLDDPKAAESRRGEIGPANTLGGQQSRDLSAQFLLERQDLRNQRNGALVGVGQQQAAQTAGAITGGVASGVGLYNAIAGMQAAQQAAKPSGIPGQFGIDVVDPLHGYDPNDANFNFNIQRAMG